MAPTITNRFALLDGGDEWPTLLTPHQSIPNLNQGRAKEDDTGWNEVKPRGTKVTKATTLVIKAENRPPSNSTRKRPILNSIKIEANVQEVTPKPPPSEASPGEKIQNQYENWCGACQIRLPSKNAILAHVKQTPKHENYCNLCKRVFKDRNGLKNHVDHAVGHDIFCNICLSAFNDHNGLRNHFENNYTAGHEFVCLVCLVAFRAKQDIDRHLHSAPKHVWCNTCHRKFRDQTERDEHWVKTKKHRHCLQPGCEFDAPSSTALEHHLTGDHYRCEGCKAIFPSQTKLHAHEGSCFSCLECGLSTKSQSDLSTHMTTHMTAKLECWACEQAMGTHSNLIEHLESGRCANFTNPDRLMQFLGEWWFSPLYMDVSIHMQIRTRRVNIAVLSEWANEGTVKPFICRAEGCGKGFSHLSSLVLHVESRACSWDTDKIGLEKLARDFRKAFGLGSRDSTCYS